MFLTSFNVYSVFGYACIAYLCRKTTVWLFLRNGLAFFGENRLATLLKLVSKLWLMQNKVCK